MDLKLSHVPKKELQVTIEIPTSTNLYARMRGVKDAHAHGHPHAPAVPPSRASTSHEAPASADELTIVLREATLELRAIRSLLEKRETAKPEEPRHV